MDKTRTSSSEGFNSGGARRLVMLIKNIARIFSSSLAFKTSHLSSSYVPIRITHVRTRGPPPRHLDLKKEGRLKKKESFIFLFLSFFEPKGLRFSSV